MRRAELQPSAGAIKGWMSLRNDENVSSNINFCQHTLREALGQCFLIVLALGRGRAPVWPGILFFYQLVHFEDIAIARHGFQ